MNRLTQVNTAGAPNLTLAYNALGNITSKSNVGSYAYGAGGARGAGPHAVTSAGGVSYGYDANGNMTTGNGRTISWTVANKPSQIQQSNRSVTFEYGPHRERYQRIDSTPSGTTFTRYVGSVEIITRPGGAELKRYLPGGVVVTVTGATSERLALFHDHLDSVTLIVDDAGQVAQRLAFDAFGKRRSTTDWTTLSDSQIWGFSSLRTTRGFTFHEQLDPVGLVHMNGRVYDPHLGRFLSPDPFVQAPGDTQNLNRYSYVINNPLSYTDPSGYFFKKIGKAVKRFVKNVVIDAVVNYASELLGPTPFFWATVAFYVARASMNSGGSSSPGAFGNGGNVWRGGGRTVFVPALNGEHGHGFLTAGLTGFALQGHEAGVEAGKEHILNAGSIVHEVRAAHRGGTSSHAMESALNRPRTARQQISVLPVDFPIFSETGEQETQYRETYVWAPVDRRGGLAANVGQGFVVGLFMGGPLSAARGALEGLIESLIVYTQHGEKMVAQDFLYRRDWKVFVITYDENDIETGRRVLRDEGSEPVWKPASSGGRHSYPAARQCWLITSKCE
ncbi:MAG: RHS repeat-associated core domain-containing protein [Gammaproteobacteria bacterium]|nr:RHS repeat-associated core domain-containing protein [Gammaproteobacteria bacterium]